MTYTELIEMMKAERVAKGDYYISTDMKQECRSCDSNLDYYSKIVDYDDSIELTWKKVKCLRCGSTTVIKDKEGFSQYTIFSANAERC